MKQWSLFSSCFICFYFDSTKIDENTFSSRKKRIQFQFSTWLTSRSWFSKRKWTFFNTDEINFLFVFEVRKTKTKIEKIVEISPIKWLEVLMMKVKVHLIPLRIEMSWIKDKISRNFNFHWMEQVDEVNVCVDLWSKRKKEEKNQVRRWTFSQPMNPSNPFLFLHSFNILSSHKHGINNKMSKTWW